MVVYGSEATVYLGDEERGEEKRKRGGDGRGGGEVEVGLLVVVDLLAKIFPQVCSMI